MRHLAYTVYLLRHKTRVFAHSLILGVPVRGLFHDCSKFSRVEWRGIGRQFYPSNQAEKDENGPLFSAAKAHHRQRNLHEIDHWHGENDECAPIPVLVLKETMADWAAFGGLCLSRGSIRHQARQCYEKWGRNYRMDQDARAWIEDFLGIVSGEGPGDD